MTKRMLYRPGGTMRVKDTRWPVYRDEFLEAAHRQHQDALARESWAPERERLRARMPVPPILSGLARRLPAPRGRASA